MELLVAAARQEHAAVVLVTHDSRVARSADRIVSVHDGRVAQPQEAQPAEAARAEAARAEGAR
jgi:ABC-type lipoprotein export system ATPase subunit